SVTSAIAGILQIDTAAPTSIATVTALSADTGSSSSDFITKTAAQTVSGTYTGTLGSDEKIQISLDGTTWIDASASSGTPTAHTPLTHTGVPFYAPRRSADRSVTSANAGILQIDTAAPASIATVTALSADTGSSSSDFITKTAAQTVSGTYTGTL